MRLSGARIPPYRPATGRCCAVALARCALASPPANFAKHLCRDEQAVLAALQHSWSNGPVEGHVHRLKPIKRSMYGRANFDLLRLRVVSAA
jgi:transposase